MTLRSFRGVPVQKLETFYLPKKKLVIFRGVPVKKNTLYVNPHRTHKTRALATLPGQRRRFRRHHLQVGLEFFHH